MDRKRSQIMRRLRIVGTIAVILSLPLTSDRTSKLSFLTALPLTQFFIVMATWALIVFVAIFICLHYVIQLSDMREKRIAQERAIKEKVSAE